MQAQEIFDLLKQEKAVIEQEQKANDEKRAKLYASIERAKKRIDKLEHDRWNIRANHFNYHKAIETLAQELANKLGLSFEVLGPFGMGINYALWFFSEDEKKEILAADPHSLKYIRLSISLYHDFEDDCNILYDTLEDMHLYPKGSIADLNGDNNRKESLPRDYDEIIRIMQEQKDR